MEDFYVSKRVPNRLPSQSQVYIVQYMSSSTSLSVGIKISVYNFHFCFCSLLKTRLLLPGLRTCVRTVYVRMYIRQNIMTYFGAQNLHCTFSKDDLLKLRYN